MEFIRYIYFSECIASPILQRGSAYRPAFYRVDFLTTTKNVTMGAHMLRIGGKAFYCGLGFTVITSAASSAADLPADTSPQLEEVVVTATRIETDLQRTPIAVTALSGDTLRTLNVASLVDVASFVPSLSIGSRSGTSTAEGSMSIRGMGVDATGSQAAVGVYVDDVYFSSIAGNLLGLLDVDRVEVLRGPQGTLFGRNTIAGAIQYVTREPDQVFGGYVDVTGGNFDRKDVQAAINIPLSETFAVRIVGSSTDRGGFDRDLYSGTERGGDRTETGRIKARWTPNDRLTVDLKAEYSHESTNGRAVAIGAVNPNAEFVGLAQLFGETQPLNNSYLSTSRYSFAGFNAPDYFHFYFYVAQADVKYQITDDIYLKVITAYSSYLSRLAQDFDMTPLSILSATPSHDKTGVFSQEVQLNGKSFADRLKWTAGVFYYDSQLRDDPGQGIQLGFGPLSSPYGNPATYISSEALFGQATYNLTDRFSVAAGLRYSRETNKSWLIDSTSPEPVTFTNTSPHFGLNFQADKDTLLYVSASEGFRAGGFTSTAALPGNGLAYNPETAWTYEAGARMEFLDRRLRVNPSIFLTDWKDIQFNVLVPTSTTVVAATANAGDARIKGFELETQFAATDRVQLMSALSLLDGHYTRVDDLTRTIYPYGFLATFPNPATGQVFPGSSVSVPNISLGTPLQRAPKTKISVGAQYAQPFVANSRLVGSMNYAWTSQQQSAVTIGDSVTLPSYGLLNARLEYVTADERWSVGFFGTNLTNKYYLIGGVNFAAGYTVGAEELDLGRPREYGIDLKARF
jgi:iron complex outermembrane receptor protein